MGLSNLKEREDGSDTRLRALVCMGPDEWEATEQYYGTNMFWSQYGPEKSLQPVKDAGFQPIFDRILERGRERHYWILARNKK